jgi:hypothetical protein
MGVNQITVRICLLTYDQNLSLRPELGRHGLYWLLHLHTILLTRCTTRPGNLETELSNCGVLPDELDAILRLLACVNGGIEEVRLAYSVDFDLLKVCWVLDALEPLIVRAAGMLLVTKEVRAAIETRSAQATCYYAERVACVGGKCTFVLP